MNSPCLSAGGLRFLEPPCPAGGLGLPYGWLTDYGQTTGVGQTPSGFPRSTLRRCARGGCPLYRGSEVSEPPLSGLTVLLLRTTVSVAFSGSAYRGLIKGSLTFIRPVFLWPGFAVRPATSLGVSLLLGTPQLPATHAKGEDNPGHWVGNLTVPLTKCDLVSQPISAIILQIPRCSSFRVFSRVSRWRFTLFRLCGR